MNKDKMSFGKFEEDILLCLSEQSYVNQRSLAEISGYSVGTVNKAIKKLSDEGLLDADMKLTNSAEKILKEYKPKNAIILAAGFGMRMVPINLSSPKALLEIKGECLIERTIRQLHEADIEDITVVVGFMKEAFEYLIDDYDVKLVVNNEYNIKNNLSSLNLVRDRIDNTYIIPSDVWFSENPFRKNELYSWYMVSDKMCEESTIRINRKGELVSIPAQESGNRMIGLSYLSGEEANVLKENLSRYSMMEEYDDSFWEDALLEGNRMIVLSKEVEDDKAVEINTYEQLREFDSSSNHLKSDAIDIIMHVFKCKNDEIKNIEILKKGMTNRSFLFTVNEGKFIMRIPGEGTEKLINRQNEAAVYKAIQGYGICDDPVYFNSENGYKITRFLNEVRNCDAFDEEDLQKCMKKLRDFHNLKIKVNHEFDIFGQIEFYETLWGGTPSVYRDYSTTKEHILELKEYIDSLSIEKSLTHIDAVCDNFLFYKDGDAEKLQLTDLEYSGMQDPHVDIAMFCIYSLYSKEQADHLIDIYFEGKCDKETRTKIYCYIASSGLLWSNWCEFKRKFGVEFGEYSLRQYRFAKDFYKYAKELM